MSPQRIDICQYNAFTDQPFAGNPAAVVLDASGLDDEVMQLVARQMNLAETAFLLPPSGPGADVRLRWFTPGQEVTLCGHATIATFSAATQRGVFPVKEGAERVLRVETLSGVLRITIGRRSGIFRVAMQIPVPTFETVEVDRQAFAAIWGVVAGDLDGEWLVHTGLNYWYVPVVDRTALSALTLETEKLAAFDSSACVTFFTSDTVDPESDWHLRFFAPFFGVPEDIVTGSAHGPMGALHLRRTGGLAEDGWTELRGEQGDLLGRPGRVVVRAKRESGAISDLEIAGTAVEMLEGTITI
jgi:PhzF family phenazine biosynthesis protein